MERCIAHHLHECNLIHPTAVNQSVKIAYHRGTRSAAALPLTAAGPHITFCRWPAAPTLRITRGGQSPVVEAWKWGTGHGTAGGEHAGLGGG